MFTCQQSGGRLGNQFIRNMMIYLLSKKYNTGGKYENPNEFLKLGINFRDNHINNFKSQYIIPENECVKYLEDDMKIDNCTHYNLQEGYYQSPNHIKHITNYFSNHDNELCKSIIDNNKFKYKNNNDIFIHIRAGDIFIDHPPTIPQYEYYEKVID